MPDRNVEIMEQLYSKLTSVVAVGANSPYSGSFLMLENPGTFLDPDYDLSNVDNELLWANALNRIPSNSWIYQDTGLKVDELYESILRNKELPIHELTASQKKQLADAKKFLGIPGESFYYRQYKKFAKLYDEASLAYDNAVANNRNLGTPLPRSVVRQFTQAKNEWITQGYKIDVEKNQSIISNLASLDPNIWWGELQTNFDLQNVVAATGDFYRTLTLPTYEGIHSNDGWTKFTLTEEDIVKQSHSSHVSVGGGVSGRWGLWKASASGNYQRDEVNNKSQVRNLFLTAEVKRVTITREWLDPLVFKTRAWRWGASTPTAETVISDGGNIAANPPITPNGEMPFFPIAFVAVRNLTLAGDFSEEEYSRIDTSFSTSVSVGWGPFSFSGRYNKRTTDEYFHGQRAGNTISCPGVQIIGHICNVLPKCPNPSQTLEWPTPITLAHIPEYSPKFIRKLNKAVESEDVKEDLTVLQ